MKKGSFQDNIEKIVRLLPRPMMNGKLIAKSRNFWLIVEEYGEEDGIVVLNKITDHGARSHTTASENGKSRIWSSFLHK